MNKQQFGKLLNWTSNHTNFQFKGKFYKQLDGMTMGSPLAPAMAPDTTIHTTCKREKLFPYKDKQPHLQQFNVTYQVKCDCEAELDQLHNFLSITNTITITP